MFTGANISICCSVSLLIGEHRRVKWGSESCHHDTDHDMVYIYMLTLSHHYHHSDKFALVKEKGVCMCMLINSNY